MRVRTTRGSPPQMRGSVSIPKTEPTAAGESFAAKKHRGIHDATRSLRRLADAGLATIQSITFRRSSAGSDSSSRKSSFTVDISESRIAVRRRHCRAERFRTLLYSTAPAAHPILKDKRPPLLAQLLCCGATKLFKYRSRLVYPSLETPLPSAGSLGLRPCWRSHSSGMPSPSVSSGAFSLLSRPAAHFVLRIDHPVLPVADAFHDAGVGRVAGMRGAGRAEDAFERGDGRIGARAGAVDVELVINAHLSERRAAIAAARPSLERDRQIVVAGEGRVVLEHVAAQDTP